MPSIQQLKQALYQLKPSGFNDFALQLFQYQARHNAIYREYLYHLNRPATAVKRIEDIPFLPIEFFKYHRVLTGSPEDSPEDSPEASLVFESSGTTAKTRSRHYVADPQLYLNVSERIFEATYGPLSDFHILALLPSYLERNNSSLVYMVEHFIQKSGSSHSGFFLHDHVALIQQLKNLAAQPDIAQKKVLLLGVTFALLDLAESGQDWTFLRNIPQFLIMETGGMKGRREELLREELHTILTRAFGVERIHSEYGMTELLSQAYSPGEGSFIPSATLRICLRDINDPFSISHRLRSGGINVIDLANIDSCAFIETKDIGAFVNEEGHFRVLGRFDNSDIRGCNLMVV